MGKFKLTLGFLVIFAITVVVALLFQHPSLDDPEVFVRPVLARHCVDDPPRDPREIEALASRFASEIVPIMKSRLDRIDQIGAVERHGNEIHLELPRIAEAKALADELFSELNLSLRWVEDRVRVDGDDATAIRNSLAESHPGEKVEYFPIETPDDLQHTLRSSPEWVVVERSAILTNEHFEQIDVGLDDWGPPFAEITLTISAGKRLSRETIAHPERFIALVLDDRAVMVAMPAADLGQHIQVVGLDSDVIRRLRMAAAGALPCPVHRTTTMIFPPR